MEAVGEIHAFLEPRAKVSARERKTVITRDQ